MTRDSQVRDVTFLDFIIAGEPDYAPTKDMEYFIDKLKAMYDKQEEDDSAITERWNKSKTLKIYIRDMGVDKVSKTALILLYHNDGNAAGVSYSHLDNNNHRDEPPQDREGVPQTAHLLLSLESKNKGERRYVGLLEEANKLNRSQVQSYLNFLFREIKKLYSQDFESSHPDGEVLKGKPKKYKYKNKFEVQGHPSPEFKQMLEHGKLSGISLITQNHDRFTVGDGTYVRPQRMELQLTATTGKWTDNTMSRFKEAIKLGKAGEFEDARIAFFAPDGKPHTAKVNTTTGNVYADKFIKQVRLKGFTILLPNADPKINSQIKKKMREAYKA